MFYNAMMVHLKIFQAQSANSTSNKDASISMRDFVECNNELRQVYNVS